MFNSIQKRVIVWAMILTLLGVDFLRIFFGIGNSVEASYGSQSSSQNIRNSTFSGSFNTNSIPNFRSILSITSNNGNVTYSQSGSTVSFTAYGGSSWTDYSEVVSGVYTPSDTIFVTGQSSSYYSSGGYYGSLTQYVSSGTYTEAHTKTVSESAGSWGYGDTCDFPSIPQTGFKGATEGAPARTKDYNSDGYTGTLSLQIALGGPHSMNGNICGDNSVPADKKITMNKWTATGTYTGSVTKPASDTRSYAYQGNVTKPASDTRVYATKYNYSVTMNYETHDSPVISSATATRLAAPSKAVRISGNVSDGNGDRVNGTYQIKNGSNVTVLSGTAFTNASGSYSFDVDLSTLTSGNYTAVINASDGYGYSTTRTTGSFNIDNTAPSISYSSFNSANTGTVNITTDFSDSSSINSRTVVLYDSSKGIARSTNNPTTNSYTTTVANNGTYYIKSSATDAYNNSNNNVQSSSFSVSRAPAPNNANLSAMNLYKYGTVNTLNLENLFTSYEWNGYQDLTYRITTDNAEVATATQTTISGQRYLSLYGVKQGSTNIKIYATNKSGKESAAITVPVNVINRGVTLNIDNSYPIIIGSENNVGLPLNGTVHDLDRDIISVTSTFTDSVTNNQTTESVNLESLGVDMENWSTKMRVNNLKTGIFYNKLNVVANDNQGATDTKTQRSQPIVVVKDEDRYSTLASKYSTDIGGVNIYSWTSSNHSALFTAYEEMQKTEKDTKNIEQVRNTYLLLRDGKLNGVSVEQISDGQVKDEFYSDLSDYAYEWIKENFESATILDYEIIDKNYNVTTELLPHANLLNKAHLQDKNDDFTKQELARSIQVSKDILSAIHTNTTTSWYQEVLRKYEFNAGINLAAALDVYIEEGMLNALHFAPKTLNNDLLNDYFKTELSNELLVVENNEGHYITYFNDLVKLEGKPTVLKVLETVESVNNIVTDYDEFLKDPQETTLANLNDSITALIPNTEYQKSWKDAQKRLEFIEFIYNIENKEIPAYEYFGIGEVSGEPKSKYTRYIYHYMNDRIINIEDNDPIIKNRFEIINDVLYISDDMNFYENDVQKVVDLVNELREYETDDATLEEVESRINVFETTNVLYSVATEEKIEQIWDKLNNQSRVEKITINELDRIGGVLLKQENLLEYRAAFVNYRKELTTDVWTLADVQLIIDTVNALLTAQRTPTTSNIANSHYQNDLLNKDFEKTTNLYGLFEVRIEQIAVDYIVHQVQTNGKVSFLDIEQTNVKGFNYDFKEDYVLTLEDEIRLLGPTGAAKLNKKKVQNLVDALTLDFISRHINYKEDEANTNKLTSLINAINGLSSAGLSTISGKYNQILSTYILQHLYMTPDVNRQGIYSLIGLDYYDRFNIELYAELLPYYPQDIKNHGLEETFSMELLQNAIYAMEKYVELINKVDDAIENGTYEDETILNELFVMRDYIDDKILDGEMKTKLLGDMYDIILKKLNDNNFTITTNSLLELIQIQNLNPDLETLYRDALTSYKEDLEFRYLNLNDVQMVIDLMNSINKLSNSPLTGEGSVTTKDISDMLVNIGKVEDGSMKNLAVELVDEVSIRYIEENIKIDNVSMADFENLKMKNISKKEEVQNDYLEYLKNVVDSIQVGELTKEMVQQVIDNVNATNEIISKYNETQIRENLNEVIQLINALVDGSYKEKKLLEVDEIIIIFINTEGNAPDIEDIALYTQLEAPALEENKELYNQFITQYIEELENPISKTDVQDYIAAINVYEENNILFESFVNPDELDNLVIEVMKNYADIQKLHDGNLKDELSKQNVLDFVNIHPEFTKNEFLKILEIQDLNENLESNYANALAEYQDDVPDSYLFEEDIQLVVDLINSINKLKNSDLVNDLTTQDFTDMIENLILIYDGNLKTTAKNLIDEVIIDYIEANILDDKVNIIDLKNVGIEHISEEESIQNQYLMYLKDKFLKNPNLDKQGIQKTINTVNELNELKTDFLTENTREKLEELRAAVNDLENGELKDTMSEAFLEEILTYINGEGNAAEINDGMLYSDLGADVIEKNIDKYNDFLGVYLKDNDNGLTKADVLAFVDAINGYEEAKVIISNLTNGITSAELDAFVFDMKDNLDKIKSLEEGETKEALLNNVFETIKNIVNEDFEKINKGLLDLISVGNYDDDLKSAYIEDFEELRGEKTPLLLDEKEIQLIIDINNSEDVLDDTSLLNPEGIKDVLDELLSDINKLPEGGLKEEKLALYKDKLIEFILKTPLLVDNTDLIFIGIENVEEGLEKNYPEFLDMYKPLTVEKVQEVIVITNLLEKVRLDLLESDIVALKERINALEEGDYKENLTKITNLYSEILVFENNTNLQYFLTTPLLKKFEELSPSFKAKELSGNFGIYYMVGGNNTIEIDSKDLNFEATNILERYGIYGYDMVRANNERLIVPVIESEEEAVVMWEKIDNLLLDGEYKIRLINSDVEEVYLKLVSLSPEKIQEHWFLVLGFEIDNDHSDYYKNDIVSSKTALKKDILSKEDINHLIEFIEKIIVIEDSKSYFASIDTYFELYELAKSDWEKAKLVSLKEKVDVLKPEKLSLDNELGAIGGSSIIDLKDEADVDFNNIYNIILEHNNSGAVRIQTFKKELEEILDNKKLFRFNLDDNLTVGVNDRTNFVKGYDSTKTIIDMKVDSDLINDTEDLTVDLNVELINYNTGNSIEVDKFSSYVDINVDDKLHNKEEKQAYEMIEKTDGTYTLLAVPHVIKDGEVIIKTKVAGKYIIQEPIDAYFNDISTTFSRGSINELAVRSIVKGTSPEIYKPNANITRAEFAVMLARGLGIKPSTKPSNFTDVKGKWFEGEVQALYENGIIAGITANKFGSMNNLTRQDAMVILARVTADVDPSVIPTTIEPNANNFVDYEDTSNYARYSADLMVALGIIAGRGNGLVPKGNLTRAEMAKVLHFSLMKVDLM